MKWLIILFLLFIGCSDHTYIDQEIRERLFFQCLEKLPKGPEVVKYNDWDDVVDSCYNASRSMAIRSTKTTTKLSTNNF